MQGGHKLKFDLTIIIFLSVKTIYTIIQKLGVSISFFINILFSKYVLMFTCMRYDMNYIFFLSTFYQG